jgi:hypothetical protein
MHHLQETGHAFFKPNIFLPSPRRLSSSLAPIFRTLFQVPYPASPLFAVLKKTVGCVRKIPILGSWALLPRSRVQTFRRSNVHPHVPLRPNAFGATIPKGTRILHVPGKQLRSPRCLRLVSGHREVFTTSRLQVVPGSSVLNAGPISRVARSPIRVGW